MSSESLDKFLTTMKDRTYLYYTAKALSWKIEVATRYTNEECNEMYASIRLNELALHFLN